MPVNFKIACVIFALSLLCLLVRHSDAFGFPMMGGGGGCGCGGGCGGGGGGGGGCGGGCGRKKRSILEEQIKTHETAVCPQSEWRTVMLENMLEDVNSAQHSIQGSMFRQYEGGKFFVSCTENTKNQTIPFVSNGEAFCSHGNEKMWCVVAALMA